MALSPVVKLPALPSNSDGLADWAGQLNKTLQDNVHGPTVKRVNTMIMIGPAVLMPPADGSGRFYLTDDTDEVFADNGKWIKVA